MSHCGVSAKYVLSVRAPQASLTKGKTLRTRGGLQLYDSASVVALSSSRIVGKGIEGYHRVLDFHHFHLQIQGDV
jgi:hypothetical protein